MTEAGPQPSGVLKAVPPRRLKRSMASLIGGVAVGIGVAVLTVLLAGGPSAFNIGLGVVIGVLLGVWVRLADL
ncbi:MAG TPA: hypothetical protein VMV26_06165 [Alphaproteobacteria bacterium]|jgi:uncharacterized membrane protein YgaE (UPF0421/DUF939 family)|nr:hypothetical protein [Alphaproteobacteria bacterium]